MEIQAHQLPWRHGTTISMVEARVGDSCKWVMTSGSEKTCVHRKEIGLM